MKHYILQHWRGETALPVALWLNGIALTVVGVMIAPISLFGAWQVELPNRAAFFAIASASVPLLIVIPTWQIVGLWRGADRRLEDFQTFTIANAARFLTTVLMIVFIVRVVGFVGETSRLIQPAFGIGKFRVDITVLASGREVELRGAYATDVAARLQEILDANPDIRRIRLNSPGGRIDEARRLGAVILARQLNTYTTEFCGGTCILPFVAGQHRSIHRTARLVFTNDFGLPKTDIAYLRRRGLNTEFLQRWRRIGNQHWQPTFRELRYAGVINTVLGQNRGAPHRR